MGNSVKFACSIISIIVKTQYFHSDTYVTDQAAGNSFICRRLSRSRLMFTLRFLGVVFRSRNLAVNGKYDWNEWTRASFDILRMLEMSGAVFTIKGLDNFRNLRAPAVFISNHMSALETMVFPSLIAPFMDVTFVVKESLVRYPVFGHIMRARKPIVVSRSNSREDLLKVIEEGTKLLEEGTSVIIFPQSTRRPAMVRSEFNSLGTKLAVRAGVTVVPVAIKTDYWRNGRLVKDLGPLDRDQAVNISFGEPVEAGLSPKDIQQKVVEHITTNLTDWGVEVI